MSYGYNFDKGNWRISQAVVQLWLHKRYNILSFIEGVKPQLTKDFHRSESRLYVENKDRGMMIQESIPL